MEDLLDPFLIALLPRVVMVEVEPPALVVLVERESSLERQQAVVVMAALAGMVVISQMRRVVMAERPGRAGRAVKSEHP